MSPRPVALALFALIASACSKAPAPAPAGSAAPAPSAASPTASAQAAASAAPLASAAPKAEARWAGSYVARVGEVTPPKEAKEKAWTQDTGAAAVGPGTLELLVAPARGDVSGTGAGPLGELVVSGTFDGKELRASLTPRDPNAASAMTGWLTATLAAGKLTGSLRVSGRDAKVVREAKVELAPK